MTQTILVTGASSEIGQAICKRLDCPERRFILHGFKNRDRLETLQKAMKCPSRITSADFQRPDEVDALCASMKEVDILVNAAACTVTGVLPGLRDEDLTAMISVNILAPVRLCRAVIPGMVARRFGRIINISSVTATRGNRGQTVYGGTKGFLEAFTRSLAAEYGSKGLRANCVAPGPIKAGALQDLLEHAPEKVLESLSTRELGTPGDVAGAVAFLTGPDSSFINGKCLGVDGGFMGGV